MQRIGVSSLAAASEVSEVLDRIRSGKETDPFAALSKLMARIITTPAYIEIAKARETFRLSAAEAVAPLAGACPVKLWQESGSG